MKDYILSYKIGISTYTVSCGAKEVIPLGRKLKELGAEYVYMF